MINSIDINFSDILLDEKLNQNISVYGISYKTSTESKPLRIRFNKIDGFIMILVSKKVVSQIILNLVLERSKLIDIILYLLEKYWFYIMIEYSVSQFLIGIEKTTTITYFKKKVCTLQKDKSDTQYF